MRQSRAARRYRWHAFAMSNPIEERARALTDVALQTLENVCRTGDTDASRVTAATALLDRAYGKPTQAIIAIPQRTSASARLAALSDGELLSLIGEIRNARGGAHPRLTDDVGVERQPATPSTFPSDAIPEYPVLLISGGGAYRDSQQESRNFDNIPSAEISEFPFCDPLCD